MSWREWVACAITVFLFGDGLYWWRLFRVADRARAEAVRERNEAVQHVEEVQETLGKAMRALRSAIAERDALRKRTFH